MFYSQCLLSSKGPLGAIWVAAYCFKRLTKAQVRETNISSSVDKILLHALDVVAYRVLAYLLLGVVRIYSKKAEYLFHDCNEVLTKIKKFVTNTTKEALMETQCTPYLSITRPVRFELDTFDLEIVEDFGRGNVLPHEEITLRDDDPWKNEETGQWLLEKYYSEEVDAYQGSCLGDYTPVKDTFQSRHMEIDVEICTPVGATYSQGGEKLQDGIITQHEYANHDMVCVVEEEYIEHVNLLSEHYQINEEHWKLSEIEPTEDETNGEENVRKLQCYRISDVDTDIEISCEKKEDSSIHVDSSIQDHQLNLELVHALEKGRAENGMCEVVEESHYLRRSSEGLLDENCFQEEDRQPCIFSSAEENIQEASCLAVEEAHVPVNIDFQNVILKGGQKFQVIRPDSAKLDATPLSTLPGTSGRSGGMKMEIMAVPTPVVKERSPLSRKRKCLIDQMIVLPNKVLKQSINDASDLVCKRKKSPHTLLAAWRASCISMLPQVFFKPLIQCHSSELQTLFSEKKLKILATGETLETPEKFDVSDGLTLVGMPKRISEPPAVDRSDHILDCPTIARPGQISECLDIGSSERMSEDNTVYSSEKIPKSSDVGRTEHISESPVVDGSENMLESLALGRSENILDSHAFGRSGNILEFPAVGSSENMPAAPQTPVQCPAIRALCSPETPKGPDSVDIRPSTSFGTISEDKFLSMDKEINWMNEEINLWKTEDPQLNEWSGKTRQVARYLDTKFLELRKQRKDEVINLYQVMRGKRKRQCARLFYETLVLKSTGFLEVKQINSYGDISVWKLPTWDQIVGVELQENPS